MVSGRPERKTALMTTLTDPGVTVAPGDPGQIAAASAWHANLADGLDTHASTITGAAGSLSSVWNGEAAGATSSSRRSCPATFAAPPDRRAERRRRCAGTPTSSSAANARAPRPCTWSGEHSFLSMHEPPSSWPWSAPLWRGYVRSLAVAPVGWWLSIIAVIDFRLTPRHSAATTVSAVIAVLWAVVLFGLFPSVVLFARPQRLIPPSVRGQPGAVAEWLEARRGRGGRRGRTPGS